MKILTILDITGSFAGISKIQRHYSRKEWPETRFFVFGTHNVKHDPLVDLEKNLLPPLKIKRGFVKQFIKTMNKDGNGFQYTSISALFPFLLKAKKKAGIFIGLQVRLMLQCKNLKIK